MKKDFPSTDLPFKYSDTPLSGNIINGLGNSSKTKATQVFHGSGARDLEWGKLELFFACLLYTSPSPRDRQKSRMPSSA